jgi:hypothetical protein
MLNGSHHSEATAIALAPCPTHHHQKIGLCSGQQEQYFFWQEIRSPADYGLVGKQVKWMSAK